MGLEVLCPAPAVSVFLISDCHGYEDPAGDFRPRTAFPQSPPTDPEHLSTLLVVLWFHKRFRLAPIDSVASLTHRENDFSVHGQCDSDFGISARYAFLCSMNSDIFKYKTKNKGFIIENWK